MSERINPCANQDCICNCGDCPYTTGFASTAFRAEIRSGGPAIHKTTHIDSEVMKARSAQRGNYVLNLMRFTSSS